MRPAPGFRSHRARGMREEEIARAHCIREVALMAAPYEGGCLCGAIRYGLSEAPLTPMSVAEKSFPLYSSEACSAFANAYEKQSP